MSVSSHNSGGRGAIKQSPPNDPSSIIFFLQRKLPPSSCSPSTVSASPFSRRKFSPSLAARHGKISKRHYRSEELIGDDRDFFIVVRGGIYEVDLNEWKCNSVYWPGLGLEIMRGTWFVSISYLGRGIQSKNPKFQQKKLK